jgi:hypothetical protein
VPLAGSPSGIVGVGALTDTGAVHFTFAKLYLGRLP